MRGILLSLDPKAGSKMVQLDLLGVVEITLFSTKRPTLSSIKSDVFKSVPLF